MCWLRVGCRLGVGWEHRRGQKCPQPTGNPLATHWQVDGWENAHPDSCRPLDLDPTPTLPPTDPDPDRTPTPTPRPDTRPRHRPRPDPRRHLRPEGAKAHCLSRQATKCPKGTSPPTLVGALTPHLQCGVYVCNLSSVPMGRSKSAGLGGGGVLAGLLERPFGTRSLYHSLPHTSRTKSDVWGLSTCGGVDLFSVLLAPLRNLPMGEHYRSPQDFFIAGT